jgi:hypothetical protein
MVEPENVVHEQQQKNKKQMPKKISKWRSPKNSRTSMKIWGFH